MYEDAFCQDVVMSVSSQNQFDAQKCGKTTRIHSYLGLERGMFGFFWRTHKILLALIFISQENNT